tara:strand:+ start:4430 stop:5317 length:888 start_codon:yes stop_codon:yes gene_type:complete
MKLKIKLLLFLHFLQGKRTLALAALLAVMVFGFNNSLTAQEEEIDEATTEMVEGDSSSTDSAAMAVKTVEEVATPAPVEEVEVEKTFHQVLKEKFIDGGPMFMSFVLICLILGLALSIERILYLSLSTTNTKKLLEEVEGALSSTGVKGAKEVCRNTSGPVASIFYQGLERSDEGLDMVEKTVVSYGSVQLGLLEKGLSWISLFIALAPMLGFFGTVIGMIGAFDAIAAANNISPGIVADGIGVALITTVSGLLVAMVLQVFYNYILSTVDSIVNDMEDASISFIDLLVKHNAKK